MLKLILKRPDGKEETFTVTEKNSYIGRVPVVNEIQIDHPSLSRQHARIKQMKKGYAIYDLRSTNGVLVNGRKIKEGELNDGDELRLGDLVFRVKLRDQPERPRKSARNPLKDLDRIEEKMAIETLTERSGPKRGK
ncbi:MAG TPA: FHA domain-containing protein [Bdellovibrionota bacterium]|nr:FHA domain-containing protein [Bdellovibrionota bacterium]